MKLVGALLIILGSGLGLAVSIYNYLSPTGFMAPLSDTAGTPGALLVIVSTGLMLLAGLVLLFLPRLAVLAFIAVAGTLLAVLGTGWAALLLESPALLATMAVAGLGWLAFVFGGSRRTATA